MGTSHRQRPVKQLVGRVRDGLRELFAVPDGYEVRARQRRHHGVLGRRRVRPGPRARACTWSTASSPRSSPPCTRGAPFLGDPLVIEAAPGSTPEPVADPGADVIAWAHNETSTGVMVPCAAPPAATALVLVDGTSGAGGLPLDVDQTDVYYFAPQKGFASDGGLWLACSARRRSSASPN